MPTRPPEVNSAALQEQLKRNPNVISALNRMGEAIAADAALAAPKLTGKGAKSIHAELVLDSHGASVRVGWDRQHYYMQFREFGTSHENAAPFLRPAAEKPR